MISAIVSRVVILLFGTLYPAYASYKAVRTKNVKEYVKWMMYWIVFALFTCAETFTDLFLSFWFPFYYELKIIIVIWLLSPATKGSSILYRNFVHPALTRREQEIDEYISKAKEQGYHTMLQLGSKGVNYATNVIMQTAIKGGGGIVNHLRRSYSLSDLSHESDLNSNSKTQDAVDSSEVPRDLRMRAQRKAGGSHVDLYFPEMDVDIRSHSHEQHPPSLGQIRSSEDISSGYSSAEPLFAESQVIPEGGPLTRTASVGGTRGRTTRATRVLTQPRKAVTSEGEEGGLDLVFGLPHPLTSMFPELLSLDPAMMPPEAIFSPGYLQMILSNAMYSTQGETQPTIYETNDELAEQIKERIVSNLVLESVSEEENDEKITEPKKNEPNETVNQDKPSLPKEESNPPFVFPVDNLDKILNREIIGSLEENTKLDSARTYEDDKEQENKRNSECFEDAAEEIETLEQECPNVGNETLNSITLDVSQSNFTENKQLESESEQENKRLSECFEDATDSMALPSTVSEELINVSSERLQMINLERSASKDSVGSSNEQCFEDSLPEIAIVSRNNSLSASDDRKGKYNKGRAPPPPPDGRKSAELYKSNENSAQNVTDVPNKPGPLDRPSTPSEMKSKEGDLKEDMNKPNNHSYDPQVKSTSKLPTPNIDWRETSPSPSLKSKKDGSTLSRFLPKSSMTSIFNLWGTKDSGTKSTTPVVRPISPANFQSTVQYDPNPSPSKVEESSKMLIRQMSHSPSRRRHGDFD